MRRILLLITDLQIGGTPTVVRELSRRLSAAGDVHVEVASLAPWGPVADQISHGGIEVTALNAKGVLSFPVVAWRLHRHIRDKQIDTVFSFLMHANAVAAAVSVFCRGVRFFQSIQTTQPFPRWHWDAQRIVQRAAERIVVPSDSVAEAAREWANVPNEKIIVIPNAIDTADFSGANALVRSASRTDAAGVEKMVRSELENVSVPPAPSPAEGFANKAKPPARAPAALKPSADPAKHAVGFIGRLDRIKRIPDLLKALQFLDPTIHLHIFGEGAERKTIESEIARLGLNDRVVLHGAVDDPREALGQIDLLVLPSQAEGFGLVLIEAMAYGVPVVATDVPGIRDVVRNGETGLLVPVASPERLAEAIRILLNDSALRKRLTTNAKDDIRRRFSWEIVLPMYRKTLGLND